MRNFTASVRAGLVLFFTVCLTAIGATPASAAVDYERVYQSIVQLHTTYSAVVDVPFDTGEVRKYQVSVVGMCTGVILTHDGYIGTAGHCIEVNDAKRLWVAQELAAQLILQGFSTPGDEYVMEWPMTFSTPVAEVSQPRTPSRIAVFSDDASYVAMTVDMQDFNSGDNAILKIANVSGMPTLPVADTTPAVGEALTSFGFPGVLVGGTDSRRQPPTATQMNVTSHSTSSFGVPMVHLDGIIETGMSGGPVLNKDGQVVGVNSGGYSNARLNYMTDLGMFRAMLDSNGVKYSTETLDSTVSAEVSTSESGVGIASPGEVPSPEVVHAPVESSSESMGALAGAGIAAGVIVALAAVAGGGFYLVRRRKSAASTPEGGVASDYVV